MLVQVDKHRSIEIPPSDKFKSFVVASFITSNEVVIISKHKSDELAIRAGKTFQYNSRNRVVKVVLEDGLAYSPDAFIGW
jgi:hypothetical protein